jgi:hypothetical protein
MRKTTSSSRRRLKSIAIKTIKGMKFCTKPDRHEPRMKCGYPLPCPFHTVRVGVVVERKKS